jgi:hypothetical protein
MAKQSFSVGQVLTAAQMTSLQQTAMGGGSPSVKTASYTLVAADAGTVIQVNSTSATTVTVNTGLFSAGDSVQIQNIGAGTTTITAGTATVNSAGSLGVTQYDGGFLYFSSASSAIWFDYTQAGTTLPLTTKGDLFGYSTTNARIPVGANATVLTADSTEALGVKWASAAGAKTKWVQIATTNTTSGTSFSFTSISGYSQLAVVFNNVSVNGQGTFAVRINADSSVLYTVHGAKVTFPIAANYTQVNGETRNDQDFRLAYPNDGNFSVSGTLYLSGCNDTGFVWTQFTCIPNTGDGYNTGFGTIQQGFYKGAATVSSLNFSQSATFDGGSATLYGSVA